MCPTQLACEASKLEDKALSPSPKEGESYLGSIHLEHKLGLRPPLFAPRQSNAGSDFALQLSLFLSAGLNKALAARLPTFYRMSSRPFNTQKTSFKLLNSGSQDPCVPISTHRALWLFVLISITPNLSIRTSASLGAQTRFRIRLISIPQGYSSSILTRSALLDLPCCRRNCSKKT